MLWLRDVVILMMACY